MKNASLIVCLFALLPLATVQAEDWPQWYGPNRDGVIRQKNLVREIPSTGLKVLWRQPIAGGYSGPSVAGGKVIVTDYDKSSGDASNDPGGRRQLSGQERVLCFDASSGKKLWEYSYPCQYNISYPAGPRCNPTISGDSVLALGAEGDLVCLNIVDGSLIWKKSLRDTYQAETPIWGYSAPPLVFENSVITLAGGEGSIVVSLDLKTGNEKWRALSATEIGYCPPQLLERDGIQELLIWTADELCGLDPMTGKVYWQVPLQPRYGMSIAAPQISGNMLFACGIGDTAAMYRLGKAETAPELLWKGKPKMALYCANSTPVFVGNVIYGADCQTGAMLAVNAKDGSRTWESFAPTTGKPGRASHGTVFLNRYEDLYFLFTETGDFVISKLTPEAYSEIGRTHLLEPTGECFGRNVVWSYPAYANGSLFVRNDKEIICVDVSADQKGLK
jgi:outer membrane protein assembly factor BamB